MAVTTHTNELSSSDHYRSHPHIKGMKYVIFPSNTTILYWDFLMILVICYYAFALPYHFGIGGGYKLYTNTRFFIFNTVLDVLFVTDSILWFFRAYKDKEGRTIFSLRSIALRYMKSGWLLINLLASTPTALIVYFEDQQQYFVQILDSDSIRFYFYFGLFKLFRLYGLNARIKHLMSTSKYASGLWVKINIMTARMFLFLVVIILLLETVGYLSSRYLNSDDQAEIALQCRTLEFAAGEHFSSHPEFGRGLLIFKYGLAFTSRNLVTPHLKINMAWTRNLGGHAAEKNEVLVEDDYCKEQQLVYHFLSYTKVLFVPRSAIMSTLEKNPVAWKECARWRYFRAALILLSLKKDDELQVV